MNTAPSVDRLSAAIDRAPQWRSLRPLTRSDAAPVTTRFARHAAEPRTIRLDAGFAAGGAWAGVERLAELAFLDLSDRGQTGLLANHQRELFLVLPGYRDRLDPQDRCLTDTASAAEKTRFYAVDRAYRLVHGLVGLVLAWKGAVDPAGSWRIAVHHFDQAENLSARFFIELARRAGGAIEVVVGTPATWSDGALPGARLGRLVPSSRLLEPDPIVRAIDAAAVADLEARIEAGDELALEQHYPGLIAHHAARGDARAAAAMALKAFILCNSYGYYHEARALMMRCLPHFDALVGDDEVKRIYYVSKMNMCLVMTNDPAGALDVVSRYAAAYLTKPHLLANLNYILGMHYLRYAEAKDIERAEHHILLAVSIMRTVKENADTWQNPFQSVFIDNGLAFVRARQGRYQEAIDLCEAGYAFMTRELGHARHRLHRSVLQYNIAQVYVMLGRLEQGLDSFRKAIAMDPHYSEYHNEIGNLLQEQQRYDEAIAHYEQAIRCSSPYPEVYFNKAVCHARTGDLENAVMAFDIGLALDPDQPQTHAIRADALRELGRCEEALVGYDTALALGYDTVPLRVNRAVLHYNNGAYSRALADMDHVIAAEPGDPAHYENRAAIHEALDRADLTRRDLAAAERCREAA